MKILKLAAFFVVTFSSSIYSRTDLEVQLVSNIQTGDLNGVKDILSQSPELRDKLLVDKALIDTTLTSTMTPLHLACYYVQIEIILYLLEQDNVNPKKIVNITSTDRRIQQLDGGTALHIIATWTNSDVANYYINKSMDIRIVATLRNYINNLGISGITSETISAFLRENGLPTHENVISKILEIAEGFAGDRISIMANNENLPPYQSILVLNQTKSQAADAINPNMLKYLY